MFIWKESAREGCEANTDQDTTSGEYKSGGREKFESDCITKHGTPLTILQSFSLADARIFQSPGIAQIGESFISRELACSR